MVGKSVKHARPCARCGATKNVFITYAVPLEKGGQDSEWNWSILCNPCRLHRKRLTEDPSYAGRWHNPTMGPKLSKERSVQRVAIGDDEFDSVIEAAFYHGKSRQTIYNWIYRGANRARYIKG